MPRPSPSSPACWPQQTPERKCAPSSTLSPPLHRAALFSLAWLLEQGSAMALTCYPMADVFSVTVGVGVSACLSWTAGAFRKDDNVSVKVYSSKEANIKCSSHAKLQVFNEWLDIKEAFSCHISALLSLSQHWCWLLLREPLHLTLLGFLGWARNAMPRNWLLFKRYYRTTGNAEKQV